MADRSAMDIHGVLMDLAWRPTDRAETRELGKVSDVRRWLESRTDGLTDHDGRWKVRDRAIAVSIPHAKVRVLYRIVRATQPKHVIEFGSALGVSGAAIGVALEQNNAGTLTTFELSPQRSRIAGEAIGRVTARYETVAASYLDHLDALDGANLLFFDGGKDENAYRAVLTAALDRMRAPAVIVVDDVDSWDEVRAAWTDVRSDPRWSGIGQCVDLGVGLLGDINLGERHTPTAVLTAARAAAIPRNLRHIARHRRAIRSLAPTRTSTPR